MIDLLVYSNRAQRRLRLHNLVDIVMLEALVTDPPLSTLAWNGA